MAITFKNLLDFVLNNKAEKVFIKMTELQIASELKAALDAKTLYYSLSPEGQINGMILACKIEDAKVLFVKENLAMNLTNLKKFAEKAIVDFGGYRFEWFKHGINKQPDTEKLYKKLGVIV